MRPAGRGPLESLYFDYPRFVAPRARELDGNLHPHKVAIAGAGPVGMTAALTLARYGIPSVLLDRKDTFNDGSRAICLARPSMHILHRIGVVQPFLRKALGWNQGRSYYRGQQIYKLEMPHTGDDKYLPMYNLQQQYIEQYLHEAVQASPLIEMRWQSEVAGVSQDGNGVDLTVSSPGGRYRLRADWLLAADGARSPLRTMMGLRLKGENYEGRYVIADVRMEHDFPTERRAFFGSTSVPGGTVLLHKQPNDLWRIDYQLAAEESDADAIAEPHLRGRIQAILAEIGHKGPWDLEWWSIYTANTLLLDEYRHGRVFFVGDSAHIVPIFGVRGLNNGLADANNIGWKLAYVLDGNAPHRLLDSYTPERRGATLDVFANASKSTRFMTPPSRGWWLAREAALSLSLDHEFPRSLADPRQMQPYTYAESPIVQVRQEVPAMFDGGPASGAFAPDCALRAGDHLLDRTGDGFTLLTFAGAGRDDSFADIEMRARMLDPRFLRVTIDGRESAAWQRYDAKAGTAYLLRPDLHVAARWRQADSDDVLAAIRTGLGEVVT